MYVCTDACIRATVLNPLTILHDTLIAILQNRSQTRQQVLDWRRHLGHADNVDNGLQSANDRGQHVGVLLAQVLVEHHTQVAHQLLFAALLHHHRDTGDQVGGLEDIPCETLEHVFEIVDTIEKVIEEWR